MKERMYELDVLRAIAITGVIFIHVNSIEFNEDITNLNYFINITLGQIVNFSVPLFLFLSGFLLAGKRIGKGPAHQDFLKKQLPRVLVPFLIWSLVYSFWSLFRIKMSLGEVLTRFFTFQATGPLYFIFLIVQYYILAPALTVLGKSKKGVLIALAISLTSCLIIELIRFRLQINVPLVIYAGNFFTWLVFPVLGIYVFHHKIPFSSRQLFVASVFLLILSVLHTYYLVDLTGNFKTPVGAVKISSFLYSIATVLFLFSIKKSLPVNAVFVNIGLMSFGIFFSHMLVLDMINYILVRVAIPKMHENFVTKILLTLLILSSSYLLGLLSHRASSKAAKANLGY